MPWSLRDVFYLKPRCAKKQLQQCRASGKSTGPPRESPGEHDHPHCSPTNGKSTHQRTYTLLVDQQTPPRKSLLDALFLSLSLTQTEDHVEKKLFADGVRLPDHIHVQSDNCSREGKNSPSLLFLAMLVQRGFFRSACQEHLTSGHSHCDVDQRFSEVGTRLRSCDRLENPHAFAEAIQAKVKGASGKQVTRARTPRNTYNLIRKKNKPAQRL